MALPLGAEADSDWLDLSFTKPLQPEVLLQRMAPLLPSGFELLEAHVVQVHAPALSQALHSAHWRMTLQPPAGETLPSAQSCQEALGELLGSEALPLVEQDRQGRRRCRDLRPLLLDLHWHHWNSQGLEVGLETLVQANGRSLKPDQLRQLLSQRLDCELHQNQLRRVALKLAC